MVSSCFVDSLMFLKWLETDCGLEALGMAEVQRLRLMTGILKIFFSYNGKWDIEDANFGSLLNRIETLVRNADQELIQISSRIDSRNLDDVVSNALEKFELIRPDIQEVYTILSKSSRSAISMSYEALKESLDSLLEILDALLRCRVDSVLTVKSELEAVEKNIKCLRNFLCFAAERCNEHEKLNDLLTLAEVVTGNVICLLYLLLIDDNMDEQMVNEMKIQLFCQVERINPIQPDVRKVYIKALKASKSTERATPVRDDIILEFLNSLQDHMKDLSNAKTDSIMSIRDQIEALHESLIFRRYLDLPSEKSTAAHWRLTDLLKHIDYLVNETGYIVYSAYDEMNEDMDRELSYASSDLLAEIKVAKGRCREIYDELVPHSLRSNFPRTNDLGFIKNFMQYLKELLCSKADFIAPLKHHIRALEEEFVSLAEDFNKMVKQPSEHEDLKGCWAHFRDIIYHTEHIVDSYVVGDGPLWFHKLGLFIVMEEIKLIKAELKTIEVKITHEIPAHQVSSFVGQVLSEVDSLETDDVLISKDIGVDENETPATELVVSHDNAEKILEHLIHGMTRLQILSIAGMPGIGKTTLANSLFENPSVTSCFHVQARCCISQIYQKRRVLLEILEEVADQSGKCHEMDDEDLAAKIYRSLKGKRYLIFIDDIWEIGPWKDMKACFPDDNEGSRIMFTSRLRDIAAQADTSSITYPLYPLSDSKSWEMLQDKLFKKESCPGELMRIGQQIATNCKGLPLAVDLIAGVLRMTERKADCWEKIAEHLKKQLLDDPKRQCMGAIELSYNNLPDRLKPCFLYFGGFPEDTQVPTKKLISLWIAEGFIQREKSDQIGLEDEAEAYLDELVARSLISISQTRSLGGTKASHIHDLLREYALAKAKEESFMQQIDSKSHHLPPNGNERYDNHRLCIHSEWQNFAASDPFGPRVRSLIFSGSSGWLEVYNVSFVSNNFSFLRVLDLIEVRTFNCLDSIFLLVHLRFLALWSLEDKIQQLIGSLPNLETFQMYGSTCRSIRLENIRKLRKLRHMHINGSYTLLGNGHESYEKSFHLDNLLSLSTLHLSYGDDTEKSMRYLPNLRKLKCIFLDSRDSSISCNTFPVLEFLTQLQSLNVLYGGDNSHYPCKFNFPENLKKLTLSKFVLPWSQASTIGQLPHLEVLKLLETEFEGKTWEMNEGEFLKLKFLELKSSNVAEWNAYQFPSLEQLLLEDCWKLKELPSCLGEAPKLQRLDLRFCGYNARKSAEKIEDAQKEIGNEQFKTIMPAAYDKNGWISLMPDRRRQTRRQFRLEPWKKNHQ